MTHSEQIVKGRKVRPTTRIELNYEELIDVIVALRYRADHLMMRSPEFAATYTRLADRVTAAGRDMLGEYAYE
jgi:hypothetical protein